MRQYINQKNDREDLSQEVFLKAYLQLKTLKKASHFSYWLFRIARNTCLDWRKKPLLPTTPLQETAPLIAPTSPPPPPDLWDYVYQLPEKYQIPVILKHTQKLKCQEIALLLNLPLTTVTKRLSRAYQMLRHPLHS
jgi:RNA polymerase sigma-70 factor (ECF subfamily)